MNALFVAAAACLVVMSAALPKRQGPGGAEPSPATLSMALELTQLMGKCELFYSFVAEETGQTLTDGPIAVPEEFQGVLAEVCPHLIKLIANKEEFMMAAEHLAPSLHLFQCVGVFAAKDALENLVGDESHYVQEAAVAFEICQRMFEDAEAKAEQEMEEEEAKMASSKRSSDLKTLLRELNNLLQ